MVLELVGLVGIGALATFLLIIARRRRRTATQAVAQDTPAPAKSVPPPLPRSSRPPEATLAVRSCPVCLTEYGNQNSFCVKDGAELADGPPSGPFSQGMICPTCRRGYPHDASFCPEDADELVPYGMYGASNSTQPPQRLDSRKICPSCGDRHASAHAFCGRDGTELVAVN